MRNYWLILIITTLIAHLATSTTLFGQSSLKAYLLSIDNEKVKALNVKTIILKEAGKIREEYDYNSEGYVTQKKYSLFGKTKFFYNKENKIIRTEKWSKTGKVRQFSVQTYQGDTLQKEISYRPDSSIRHTDIQLLNEEGLCIEQKFNSENLDSWRLVNEYDNKKRLVNQKKYDEKDVLLSEKIFDTKDTSHQVAYRFFEYDNKVKKLKKTYTEEYDSIELTKTINCEGEECNNCLEEFFYDNAGNEIAHKAYNDESEVEKHVQKQYNKDNKLEAIVKYDVNGDLSDKILFTYGEDGLPKTMKKFRYFNVYDELIDDFKIEERLTKYQQLIFEFFTNKQAKK